MCPSEISHENTATYVAKARHNTGALARALPFSAPTGRRTGSDAAVSAERVGCLARMSEEGDEEWNPRGGSAVARDGTLGGARARSDADGVDDAGV